jgi:hypothetical protein
MSSITTESEGYSNRINDLENRTNERIDKLYVRTETEEQFTTYLKNTLPGVVNDALKVFYFPFGLCQLIVQVDYIIL